MRNSIFPRTAGIVGFATALVLVTAGCSASSSSDSTATASGAAEGIGAEKVDSIASLLPQAYQDSGTIKIAGTVGLPPMMYVDSDGSTLVGVEADILHAVGDVFGVEIELEETKPDAFMAGILSNRFDGAAGSITYSAERAEQVDFVVYAHYAQALAVAADNDAALTFDSLCGATVAVLTGSVQQTKFLPEINSICTTAGNEETVGSAFPDANALYLAVQSGRADAAFLNEVSVLYQVEHSGGKMAVADTGFSADPKGLVVNRESGLAEAFEAATSQLLEDGVLTEIFKKWGLKSVMTETVELNPTIS